MATPRQVQITFDCEDPERVAANLARSVRPEPYVDRAGRCLGNVRAALDLMTGRLDPARILSFGASGGGKR